MKIIYIFYVTVVDTLQDDNKKEAKISGEEMLHAIVYLENSYKARFSDLKKHVENEFFINKLEYPRNVNVLQILILNYQSDYNYNRKSQSQGISNQLMFAQLWKTGDNDGETKYDKTLNKY